MIGSALVNAQRQVGAGADLQDDALRRQPVHDRLVLEGAHAVADARNAEPVERVDHGLRAHELARMGREPEPGIARDVECGGEVARMVLPLVAGEAESRDPGVRVFGHGARGFQHGFRSEMAHTRRDDAAFDAGSAPRLVHALHDGLDEGGPAEAGHVRMCGRHEDLAVDRALLREPRVVIERERAVILRRAEHRHDLVVGLKERREVAPQVKSVGVEDVGQVDPVLARQTPHQFRPRGTFQVAMQFGEWRQRAQRKLLPCGPGESPRCAATVSPISANVSRRPL